MLPTEQKREIKNKDRVVPIIRSQAGEKLDVTLTSQEVENLEELNEDILKKKYESALVKYKNKIL